MKINEDGDSKTQLYILEQHMRNDNLDNVIMDRCIIDGFVYTLWLHSEGKVTDTVLRTYEMVYNGLLNNLDIVFYTEPVQLEDDGERSTDPKFIKGIEKTFENIITMAKELNEIKVITLEGDVDKRFDDIKIAIKEHEHSTVG